MHSKDRKENAYIGKGVFFLANIRKDLRYLSVCSKEHWTEGMRTQAAGLRLASALGLGPAEAAGMLTLPR